MFRGDEKGKNSIFFCKMHINFLHFNFLVLVPVIDNLLPEVSYLMHFFEHFKTC